MGLKLKRIHVYPVKSAHGISPAAWHAGRSGFDHDHRWLIVDSAGRSVTQRAQPRLALIHVALDACGGLRLGAPGMPTLRLEPPGRESAAGRAEDRLIPANGASALSDRLAAAGQRWRERAAAVGRRVQVMIRRDTIEAFDAGPAAAAWLSEFLGSAARLVRMPQEPQGRVDPCYAEPEDRVRLADAFPYLLLSEESMADLNGRLVAPLPMARFRPNLVVAGCEPYTEEGWRRIRIGDVEFRVVRPCPPGVPAAVDQPIRAGSAGSVDALVADAGLMPGGERPPRTTQAHMPTHYRRSDGSVIFGQNLIPGGEGMLRVGDDVQVLE